MLTSHRKFTAYFHALVACIFLIITRACATCDSVNGCPTSWVCSVQCKASITNNMTENVGQCGNGRYNQYLDPHPCNKENKQLSTYAGCDYTVCASACADLVVTEKLPYASTQSPQGSIIHCFNSSDATFFTEKDTSTHWASHDEIASDATVAFGCGHESTQTHQGATYSLVGCPWESQTSGPTFNTSSSVVESEFCYGGLDSSRTCPSSDALIITPTRILIFSIFFLCFVFE